MDRQGASFMYPTPDPGLGIGTSYSTSLPKGNFSPISPFLNFDPSYINQTGPEWIFPEGASRQRGRFELAFSQIGGSVMTGALVGGISGTYNGWRETAIAGHTGSVRRTQLLNYITKSGASMANTLGVVAVMYSGFGVILSWARGVDDELNTIAAGTATGMLFKSSAGVRRLGVGGAIGFSLATAYCLWTSKDRLRTMVSQNSM